MFFGIGKKKLALLVTLSTLVAIGYGFYAGELEPLGPPGPTMKPMFEIEPRQIIWSEWLSPSQPLRIETPGSYYLASDIDATGKQGIVIAVSNVTLDLNGFSLQGGDGHGIVDLEDDTVHDVTIRNGTVSDWTGDGIRLSGHGAFVHQVNANDNGGDGIQVDYTSIVSECRARTNGLAGIHSTGNGNIISGSSAWFNQNGIHAENMTTITGSNATQNHRNGIRVDFNCRVVGNACNNNGWNDPAAARSGILVTSFRNHIEGNTLIGNYVGIQVDAEDNVITRNVSISDTTTHNIASGNDVGPWGSAATATSPWANIEK